ncbi:facilitated trehalose transporter Tret1-2 homolog [Prorops nasuta]|uniref:facilitated trehalose transporter Tret1-2 homolog n=1 Tax=Prorops nasuta TaxID=863751 RepID=UPI0034CF63B1
MIAQVKLWWKLVHSGDKKGILAGLAAHSGQISVGLSQGFSAILVPKLLESKFANQSEASWIASLGVISNPLGAIIAGLSAEWFGRRSALALATLPHAIGWVLIALSENVPMLYVGRFISGIGAGMANGIYLYVSEAAAAHQRAWLASSGPILVSFGVLIVYTLGAITSWQRTAAISVGPAILSLALSRMIPESPSWLVSRGRREEGKDSLLWLRGSGSCTEKEYEELCDCSAKREEKQKSLVGSLHRPSVWKPFLILLLFFTLQQLSGIYVILFYAVSVLKDIGLDINEYLGSVAIGIVRLFAAIVGAGLANCVGRKSLAFASGFGMALSAFGVALSFRYNQTSWVPLVCIGGHVWSSMIGFLTLPWVMTSELYPLRFRGPLGGFTTSIVQMLSFVAIKTYPDMSSSIGLENSMWIFGSAGLLGALFALGILPETRGKSLEDIEKKFSNKSDDGDDDDDDEERPNYFDKRNLFIQPNNVTLKKYATISEEKLTTMVSNAFVYDNFSFDLGVSDFPEKDSKETNGNVHQDRLPQVFQWEHLYI